MNEFIYIDNFKVTRKKDECKCEKNVWKELV